MSRMARCIKCSKVYALELETSQVKEKSSKV